MGVKTDWNSSSSELPAVMSALRSATPEFTEAFSQMHKVAFADGNVSLKTKELIAIALAVTAQCDGCILSHVKACIKLGVTREELAEVMQVVIVMGGGPRNYYSARAMDAFNQLTQA